MKKMNKKGFTLIELLAVIVILGLLMAIAIPSVTKYITQSRKKTLMNTVSNYMSALTNEVNNMEYTFTNSNVVYAVPVECIALERGGTNPFGKWYPATTATVAEGKLTTVTYESQWAYVLVYYDDNTSSYTYGFTFKDSAGYGLVPTASTKLDEKGGQVTTTAGGELNTNKANIQPAYTAPTGTATVGSFTYAMADDYYATWNGFGFDPTATTLQVLVAVEGTSNGLNTCTIAQES